MQTLDDTSVGTPAHAPQASPEPAPSVLRIAYLLSRYPAISHTFFLQEVLGLRARGMHIETVSINRPDRPLDKLPPNEAAEARATAYIQDGRPLASLFYILTTILAHPGVFFRGLAAITQLPRLTLKQRGFWLFYLAEALLVGRWMKQRRLDHLHIHFGGPVASVGMLVSAAWQLPYSLTIHGPEELLNLDAYHLREKVAQASFVLCISDFCRSQLCQFTSPRLWPKFKVIRLGVDPSTLRPIVRSSDPLRSQPPPCLELVCTGRLVPAKGHHILLQALDLLRQRGTAIHATFIGGGPELQPLKDYVFANNLRDAVTFTQALSHPETLELLRKADLFALASFAEGIPVALMEAMSLGLPCVSTTIAGIPELIRSGHDGLLVAPGNPAALADALASLAHDEPLRKRLGSAARQRILTDYNLPLNQEHLALSLQDLVATASLALPRKQR